MLKLFSIALFSIFFSLNALSATSVSILHGDTYRSDLGYRKSHQIMTIENFSVWEYGTIFFYYDITDPTRRDKGPKYYSNQFFGGIAPTISLSKLTGKEFKYGIIQDVSIRLEMENGSGNGEAAFQNYFYGLEAALLVPGFDFVSFNVVLRDNPLLEGVGVQFGIFWQSTLDYGRTKKFKFTGFLATSPWDGDNNNDFPPLDRHGRFLSTQPQFLWDLGYALGKKPDTIEVGFEFAHYLNRYQFKDKDESVLQYMAKFTF